MLCTLTIRNPFISNTIKSAFFFFFFFLISSNNCISCLFSIFGKCKKKFHKFWTNAHFLNNKFHTTDIFQIFFAWPCKTKLWQEKFASFWTKSYLSISQCFGNKQKKEIFEFGILFNLKEILRKEETKSGDLLKHWRF